MAEPTEPTEPTAPSAEPTWRTATAPAESGAGSATSGDPADAGREHGDSGAAADGGADFADLLAANQEFAATFGLAGFDGIARAGVAMVTCMDSRIDPLRMIGLRAGDAKILRNPGGRVTDQVLVALVLGANLLHVRRVLVVQHTRCAMASGSEAQLRERVTAASGADASWMTFGVITDQRRDIADEVAKVRAHPLIGDRVAVGGFLYDVDTGLLSQVC